VGRVTSKNLERMQYPDIRSSRKPLHPRVEGIGREIAFIRVKLQSQRNGAPGRSSGCAGMQLLLEIKD
jgi:hypothetical protein